MILYVIKNWGEWELSRLSQRNGKLPLPLQKQVNYLVILIYGLHTPLTDNFKMNPSFFIEQACLFILKTSGNFLESHSFIQIPEVVFVLHTSHQSYYFTIKQINIPTTTTGKHHNLPPFPHAANLPIRTHFKSTYIKTSTTNTHTLIWRDPCKRHTHTHALTDRHTYVLTQKYLPLIPNIVPLFSTSATVCTNSNY